MFKIALILTLSLSLFSCSHQATEKPTPDEKAEIQAAAKDFSKGELILATKLLTKIFDKEMAPLACVPDHDEAELLLRTIRPRMEVVEDDLEASLDDAQEVDILIESCEKDCTCFYLDELLREHQVVLTKKQKVLLNPKRLEKENNRCMNFAQTTFCQGELFKELNKEKADFSFDEAAP
jgi:hypothetical protein